MKHNMFWSTFHKGETFDDFLSRDVDLSVFHALTIIAHAKLRNDVTIYTYQKFYNSKMPLGIVFKDANEIYPAKKAFDALGRGHSIAHISDVVRMEASIKTNGIILDMDAIALRKFDDVESFYSTMPAKRTGGVAPQWGKAHPPITIHDGSWDGKALCAFPLKISSVTAPMFQDLVDKIKSSLELPPKKSSKAWNYVLWTVKDIIKQDVNGKVYKPIDNCPVPSWMGRGKCYSIESPSRLDGETTLFGHSVPSINEIMNNSKVVQHFFESAFNDSSKSQDDFWNVIPDGCLLACEANEIVGYDWREFLTNYFGALKN